MRCIEEIFSRWVILARNLIKQERNYREKVIFFLTTEKKW